MKKNKLLQLSLASFAAFAIGPVGGVAIAQEDHHHWDHHDSWACYELKLENENDIELESTITQDGISGDVVIDGNTTVGDVGSGDTRNTQTNEVDIEIDNSALVDSLPDPVAPATNNHHHSGYGMEMDIENENDIEISNTIVQTANSGTVTVTDNTTVGDVTSGSATNTSTSTISISVM